MALFPEQGVLRVVSPVDGQVFAERPLAGAAMVGRALDHGTRTFGSWSRKPLEERISAVSAFVDAVAKDKAKHAEELTWQMGRPASQCPGEISGFVGRARKMIELAPEALAPIVPPSQAGFTRFIRREPLGLVLILAPWNYPWLTAVNTLVPALLAGNSVLIKHSDQTPLVAERLSEAANHAGLPAGLVQHIHMDHDLTGQVVADKRVGHVAFTGSVAGGLAVRKAAVGRFVGVGFELGGKDPAYVRADADVEHAAPNLVEGAMYNSGQSCCGIERIYVHQDRYDQFVERAVAQAGQYTLGNPLEPSTDLGPVVRADNAARIQAHIDQAVNEGARTLIDASAFPAAVAGTPYMAPQILVDVDHSMDLMREETFGPVVGIMKVKDDAEAIRAMNDSAFGLTASVWTPDQEAALAIGEQLHTGTVFANRCDFLDPDLAWVGVGDSGLGCTLSPIGFEHLTRPKSFHLRSV